MPLELQVIRGGEFIRAGPHGHFDPAAGKAVLAEFAVGTRKTLEHKPEGRT